MKLFLWTPCGACAALLAILAAVAPMRAHGEQAATPAPVELQAAEGRFTLRATDATIRDVLGELKKQAAVDIAVPEEILNQRVTLALKNVTEEDLISALAGSNALIYERDSQGGYRLASAHLTSQQAYIAPALPDVTRSEKKSIQALAARVAALLDEHSKIIGYAGELNYDQAKALIADRKQKMQAIVDQLAALGPGGARAMNDLYAETTGVRERMAMIEALGKIDDPEAALVLGSLFAGEPSFSLQREILGSIGSRTEPAAEEVIAAILAASDDERIRAASVQAMAGRAGALDELTQVAGSTDESLDVRQESIRSIGEIGTDAAREALTQTATSSGDLALRKSAIQELGRTFGDAALPALEVLLQDEDEAIRNNAVKAIARMESPAATALLQSAARSDTSSTVRMQAEAALASRGTNSGPAVN